MLYDPKWQKQSHTIQPRTIEHLILWLDRQPSDKVYPYMDYKGCLAAQYNRAIGREYHTPNPISMWLMRSFDAKLERIGFGFPRTCGGALERARKYL